MCAMCDINKIKAYYMLLNHNMEFWEISILITRAKPWVFFVFNPMFCSWEKK